MWWVTLGVQGHLDPTGVGDHNPLMGPHCPPGAMVGPGAVSGCAMVARGNGCSWLLWSPGCSRVVPRVSQVVPSVSQVLLVAVPLPWPVALGWVCVSGSITV